jgi:hypothetical protein
MWFGAFYMLLQLIPVLSMFFLLTSATGSALWSVRIERENVDNQLEREDDLGEEYTDDP